MAFCGNWRKCRAVVPDNKGLQAFGGEVINAFEYKSGEKYSGEKVLIAVCGNSGMEVSLDLCNHNARLSIVWSKAREPSMSRTGLFHLMVFRTWGTENST